MKCKFLYLLLFLMPLQSNTKTALVCGAGGFIGSHLVKRLKSEGYFVRGVDLKYPEFSASAADEFILADLRDTVQTNVVVKYRAENSFDEVYQLAANMGGMGYIASHDAEIMHDSGLINLNVLEAARIYGVKKIFFSSSACIYPEYNQMDPNNPMCAEASAYPAAPDTEYGWEKLFSERLYKSYARDYGMIIRIARFHNIFGPEGTWDGGKEKAPAALCRKVSMISNGESIEIWGDGEQTRSFLYIEECLNGIRRLMEDPRPELPVLNIGSEEIITINNLAQMIAEIADKQITLTHIKGPQGVRGRNSDNSLIQKTLNWAPSTKLKDGLVQTYAWINAQVQKRQAK